MLQFGVGPKGFYLTIGKTLVGAIAATVKMSAIQTARCLGIQVVVGYSALLNGLRIKIISGFKIARVLVEI
jgi:hypothetical protein